MAHPILAAQDALKVIVAARPAFANVNVTDGGPTESEDIPGNPALDGGWDAFWFNDTQIPADGWASLGAQRRRVRFLLGFTIAVKRYGDDERATRARALDLFEDLMVAIKANPNLTNTVQQVDDVTGTVGSAPDSPSVWGAWFTGSLACTSKQY